MSTADRIDLSRGVDLSVIANKRQHQHSWILVANFNVDINVLAKMAEAKLAYRAAKEKAESEDEIAQPAINLPMTKANMLGVDGPGCRKCGIHWESDDGWGKLCPVSDADFEAAGEPLRTPTPVQQAANQGPAVDADASLVTP